MQQTSSPGRFAALSDVREIAPLVGKVLGHCRSHLPPGDDGTEMSDALELALTEVLNNCVEHAYAGRDPGPIEVAVDLPPGRVRLTVSDRGNAPPPALLAAADLPDPMSLPEGGWGWALIHRLTDRVSLVQEDGWNRLTLERHVPQAGEAGAGHAPQASAGHPTG